MKKSAFLKAGLAAACLGLLLQCSYDPSGPKPPGEAPNAAPAPGAGGGGGGAAPPGFDPAPPGGDAPALKEDEPKIPPPPRPIAKAEFILTIDASGVASVFEVPVHIISTTANGAGTISGAGAPEYWKQPQGGAHVTQRSFGKNGRNRTPVVRLPSVPGMDHLVLVANLAAPAGGIDSRVITVPLKLDYSKDPANPLAHPIGVKLGKNGWQRTR